jgi:hypothetical protein
MSAGVRVEQSRPAGWTPAWRWLVAGCVAAVLVVETILLALGTGYFMGGFNSVYTEGAAGVGAYLASAALLDAALVLGVLAVAVPLLRRLGVGGLELLCSAALLAVALPLVPAVARYNLHVTLGRLVSVSLLQVGSAGSAVNAASVAVDEVPDYGRIAVGGLLLGSAGVLIFARRVGPRLAGRGVRFGPPAASRLWGSFLGLWVASAVVLVASALWVPILHFGLGNKSSGALLVDIVQRVTDLDRDGYGLLSLPADPAPLDATIHPYAVDLPGNGVDENGFGGDLPVGHVLPPPVAAAGAPAEATPHFLLIYLESFRADLLDQRLDGREITPFLNQLAAEGVRSEHAFVHSPWTLPSRAQLFAGSRTPPAAGPTLIDDFLERGYTVAYFSGQDDSYGDSVERLGADRADLFYDARADLERRTSRPGLLEDGAGAGGGVPGGSRSRSAALPLREPRRHPLPLPPRRARRHPGRRAPPAERHPPGARPAGAGGLRKLRRQCRPCGGPAGGRLAGALPRTAAGDPGDRRPRPVVLRDRNAGTRPGAAPGPGPGPPGALGDRGCLAGAAGALGPARPAGPQPLPGPG